MPAGSAIHIGTSGWHYKHWLGDFYPEKFAAAKMFPWYAREFDTVEINNSFYRLPEEKTFQKWRELAPAGFIFAVKASRFITHIKRLKEAEGRPGKLSPRQKMDFPSMPPELVPGLRKR